MLVSKAGGRSLARNPISEVTQVARYASSSSYAPLYLSSSLRDIAFDIQELESYALDRLKLLKAIDLARVQSISGPKGSAHQTIRHAARQAERLHSLMIPPKGNADRDSQILKDEASHFLLRLAMCKTHEHRTWLLGLECILFATRLEGASTEYVLEAIRKSDGPKVDAVPHEEMEKIRKELDDVARGPCRIKGGQQDIKFFKVDFEQVPGLIRARRVLVKKGTAYVPEVNIHDVVVGQFRAKMNQSLTLASKAVTLADNDRRMRPILESIREHHAADERSDAFDGSGQSELISLNQLDQSIPAMPLCMMNMMAKLREQHHLRHSARMQLGVFLKGCGLSMDESLLFWRTEFGKGTIDSSKFEKTYSYNIRHYYGKEGKRRALTPFPCIKIINERPGPGEHNGCPYREFQENSLVMAIRKLGVDVDMSKAITAKAQEGNFQVACGMCFKATQPPSNMEDAPAEFLPSHPNEYFIEARRRRFTQATAMKAAERDESDDDMPLPHAMETQAESQTNPDIVNDSARNQAPSDTDTGAGDSAKSVKAVDATMTDGTKDNSETTDEQETKRQRTEAEANDVS